MLTDKQKAKRLAMIKEASKKFNAKMKRNHRVRATETSYMDKYDDGSNINHYTDASSYANKYYGETMRETTRFDNEWD